MSKPAMYNACYECKHRGSIPSNARSCCRHPDPSSLTVRGSGYGAAQGWFNWPLDFDPTWLEECDGLEAKNETPKLPTMGENGMMQTIERIELPVTVEEEEYYITVSSGSCRSSKKDVLASRWLLIDADGREVPRDGRKSVLDQIAVALNAPVDKWVGEMRTALREVLLHIPSPGQEMTVVGYEACERADDLLAAHDKAMSQEESP